MATPRDLRTGRQGDRVERLIPTGYRLPPGQTMKDVLAISAELLRSEGIDPTWPGFDESEPTGS
jgi:hypothetical protein